MPSFTDVFMGHGDFSWPTLKRSMRNDEFVALLPVLHAGKSWGQKRAVGGYAVQAGTRGAAALSLGPLLNCSELGLAAA